MILISPISQVMTRDDGTKYLTSWLRETKLDKIGWDELVEMTIFEFSPERCAVISCDG